MEKARGNGVVRIGVEMSKYGTSRLGNLLHNALTPALSQGAREIA
jgi:hypothetical protein